MYLHNKPFYDPFVYPHAAGAGLTFASPATSRNQVGGGAGDIRPPPPQIVNERRARCQSESIVSLTFQQGSANFASTD